MWFVRKKTREDTTEFYQRQLNAIRAEFKKTLEKVESAGKQKCDVYCKGCKHLIVHYKGSSLYSPKECFCALDRKCKDYEVEGK